MTDFRTIVPHTLSDEYFNTLDSLVELQGKHGWRDFLLSAADVLASVAILVGNNVGNFAVLESNTPYQRWLWISPEGYEHLQRCGWMILDKAIDASSLNLNSVYAEIMKDLKRDPATGKRISVDSDVAA